MGETAFIEGVLRRLGLTATMYDVRAGCSTAAEGVRHIEDTIARGGMRESWNREARAWLDRLDHMAAEDFDRA